MLGASGNSTYHAIVRMTEERIRGRTRYGVTDAAYHMPDPQPMLESREVTHSKRGNHRQLEGTVSPSA